MNLVVLFSLFIVGFIPFILLFKGLRWAIKRKITAKNKTVVGKITKNSLKYEYHFPIRADHKVFPDREKTEKFDKSVVNTLDDFFTKASEVESSGWRDFARKCFALYDELN